MFEWVMSFCGIGAVICLWSIYTALHDLTCAVESASQAAHQIALSLDNIDELMGEDAALSE